MREECSKRGEIDCKRTDNKAQAPKLWLFIMLNSNKQQDDQLTIDFYRVKMLS
jgi:hypothetical protein